MTRGVAVATGPLWEAMRCGWGPTTVPLLAERGTRGPAGACTTFLTRTGGFWGPNAVTGAGNLLCTTPGSHLTPEEPAPSFCNKFTSKGLEIVTGFLPG